MINNTTISNTSQEQITLNYSMLRKEGLKHVEALGRALWTDYNTHDPGITLLELVCYAITDLGYRTNFPIQNLLSEPEDNEANFNKQFFSAKEILSSAPVSELDLRKLLIDIDGIKNVWLFKTTETLYFDKKETRIVAAEPASNHPFVLFNLNGLYDIKIELDETPIAQNCAEALVQNEEEQVAQQEKQNQIIEKVRERFHNHRSLCEDLVKISIVEEQKVRFCFDVQISSETNANTVYPEVLYLIDQYLSPGIKRYTLNQMLESKKPNGDKYLMEEIFNGCILDNGFFKDDELLNAGLRKNVYASDIISLIMDIPGVLSVNNFLMNYCDSVSKQRHDWCLPIASGKKPVLCYCKSSINFYKDVIPVKAPRQLAVNMWFEKLQTERAAELSITYEDYNYIKGAWQNNNAYTSITKNLPKCYGVGDDGLIESLPLSDKVKALQLKGFLLFFDQVLANYIAQLKNLKKLFQLKDNALADPQTGTYFFQRINNVPDIERLIDGYETMDIPGGMLDNLIKEYDDAPDRKSRILDHLLSRFAENFTEYVLQMYSLQGQKSTQDIIESKAILLNEYPQISANRSAGFDYFNTNNQNEKNIDVWDTENVSGMEHRISRLLGIKNYKRRNLSTSVTDGSDEGMFVIEHILLRPNIVFLKQQEALFKPENFIPVCNGTDCDDCDIDPYSFQISVILPAESERFKDPDFRNYIEKTIRLETPAHIYPRICWWSRQDLEAFEPVYKEWLQAKQTHTDATPEGLLALQQVIKLLNERKSIYPPGVLSDCDNPVDNPVILDQSNLGNLKT